ncbi:N-acetylmuramoyl-L-alanine amidase [Algoriphagus sp. CAU 1675]|uniref:N-acetylmuramoyl-L-alanine amidase n=1 Tax=Algoriphagus sp. CAU 1675 TaxID=3032597 RepID=UPI0023DBED03|nr:N-acetylmuramoyl-L-alanine amidase [Algoriphagus sp. CAU 1675]MDF2156772.1 N-acetylmuramoyl-L-alanine amidase [Algoriphagus sp. CAU 1675]
MRVQRLLVPVLLLTQTLLFSCTRDSYFLNNKAHEKQVKDRIQSLLEIPSTKQSNTDSLTINDQWIGTTNFSIRRPNFVVIHHTAQESLDQTITTFTLTRTQVSSHYVIGRDGTIVQMLNDYLRSWHAGRGKWGNDTDLNSSSIGIELDNNGSEYFSEQQIESLLLLLGRLKEKYNIPTANFIGHSDLAPGRKVDPNVYFPWKRLADAGFGFWYDEELMSPGFEQSKHPLPENFNAMDALRIIGYDISDPEAAILSFKLHFIKRDVDKDLSYLDQLILYNLYKKYL